MIWPSLKFQFICIETRRDGLCISLIDSFKYCKFHDSIYIPSFFFVRSAPCGLKFFKYALIFQKSCLLRGNLQWNQSKVTSDSDLRLWSLSAANCYFRRPLCPSVYQRSFQSLQNIKMQHLLKKTPIWVKILLTDLENHRNPEKRSIILSLFSF